MGKQAKLPAGRGIKKISDMTVGETCWAAPDSVKVDRDRNLWLSAGASACESHVGRHAMRVSREEDGYHVWPPPDEMWSLARAIDDPHETMLGHVRFVPVAQMHEAI